MNVYWFEQCAADVPTRDEWLSEAEKTRAAALRVPKRHADWRLGRWAAKCAVGGYLHPSTTINHLAQIELRLAPSGAPVAFIGNTRAPCSVSLSHCAGRALVAIGDATVQLGCDLELVEPRSAAFIADYFTVIEQKTIESTSNPQRDTVATLLWSLKESVLKALEVGLRADTRSVEVSFPSSKVVVDESHQWHSASVRCSSGAVFSAKWRRSGDLIYTLASSHCFHPVELQPHPTAKQPWPALPQMTRHIDCGPEV